MTANDARDAAMKQKEKNTLYVRAMEAIIESAKKGLFYTTVPCDTSEETHAAIDMLVLDGYALDVLKDGNKGFGKAAQLAGNNDRHAIYLRISWSPAEGYKE